MTENLRYYARKGYVETGRGVQDGYRRVFSRMIVGSTRSRISLGNRGADLRDGTQSRNGVEHR